jgi:transketolase
MRAACFDAIQALALEDPRVVVVVSDPGPEFMPELAARHPERLMIEGICEQGIVGVSAGLASEGYYPFVIMIAVFATRRCYEQLLLDFGLHGLSGCIVGVGAGLHYSAAGPTHIAVDDILLTSAIPGSAVLSPGDPQEAIALVRHARAFRGLSYLRLAETTEPLFGAPDAVTLGQGRLLEEPGDVLFISCGAATLAVRSAIDILKKEGLKGGGIHLHTVKPLDVELIRRSAQGRRAIVCVEEHRQIGGLASAVLQALTSVDSSAIPPRFACVGVTDSFPAGYGTYQDLMSHFGITGSALAQRAKSLLDVR